ncbi:hypothetical protein ACFOTA_16255 [Chitinophaga sp. GCM10012297]|uniref:DUF4142 domain-containing protein n=1 Tax=Chitinophaga chungangae TaxID=2821488 RepID=A0ABS3YHL4_9BACT|nr:hypothetical protein [Chitinophaga chungangae]MBO9153773.1 hypothetical protein [Chitinophaga chungangae]
MRNLLAICLSGALLTGTPLFAQDETTAQNGTTAKNEAAPRNEISAQAGSDIVFRLFGKTREDLFANYLRITRSEQTEFDAALMQYETEKAPFTEERNYLLRLYNEKFQTVDEQMMTELTKNIIKNDKEFVSLQTRYYRRMIKLLGSNRAAMFFQLDNYLELASKLYIQGGLPFIKELETDRKLAVARLEREVN